MNKFGCWLQSHLWLLDSFLLFQYRSELSNYTISPMNLDGPSILFLAFLIFFPGYQLKIIKDFVIIYSLQLIAIS